MRALGKDLALLVFNLVLSLVIVIGLSELIARVLFAGSSNGYIFVGMITYSPIGVVLWFLLALIIWQIEKRSWKDDDEKARSASDYGMGCFSAFLYLLAAVIFPNAIMWFILSKVPNPDSTNFESRLWIEFVIPAFFIWSFLFFLLDRGLKNLLDEDAVSKRFGIILSAFVLAVPFVWAIIVHVPSELYCLPFASSAILLFYTGIIVGLPHLAQKIF